MRKQLGICKNCRHRWYSKKNGHILLWCFEKRSVVEYGLSRCVWFQEAKGYDKHAQQILEEILMKEHEDDG